MSAWDDIRFEWGRGSYRLSTEDSRVVMARVADLEWELMVATKHLRDVTAERDAALEAMRGVSEAFVIADPGAAKFYLGALREGQIPPSAVGGAPGVSETHTDPKEAP